MFKTPILLITFNRPDHTRRVLTEILKQEPISLYVCQDGAREGNENDRVKCQEVRDVVKELTDAYAASHKDFTLHTLYQKKNLGCGPGPSAGITWLFENEEQGIIIEDDCVLADSGFRFYEELLNRYKDDERISAITATNLHLKWRSRRSPYLFSTVGAGTLGCWAGWARAWKKFDYFITAWDDEKQRDVLRKNFEREEYYEYYAHIFDNCRKKQNHMWDYQWFFAKMLHGTMTIVTAKNMVSNIGFDAAGTHTQSSFRLANFPLYETEFPMKEVPVKRDKLYDWVVFQRYYRPTKKSLLLRVVLKAIDLIYRR